MISENHDNPLRKLKVRNFVLRTFIIILGFSFALGFAQIISGLKFNNQLVTLILYIFIFGSLCLWTLADFNRLAINLKYVVGNVPRNYNWLKMVGLVMLMILFSISASLVLFSLLSLVAPAFIEEVLRQIAKNLSPRNSAPAFYNFLGAIAYVIVAPITEEFIFRGVILQRWSAKWGIRTALIVSSLLFGFLHTNFLGLTIFAVIMGVLYIQTRTLIVPIACHAFNNLLAVSMGFVSGGSKTTSAATTLQSLRSGWWFGVLLIFISLPLLIRFLSQNWPRQDMPVSYVINASQSERYIL
jgi:membrane protease YdiL (CAAX protease family)